MVTIIRITHLKWHKFSFEAKFLDNLIQSREIEITHRPIILCVNMGLLYFFTNNVNNGKNNIIRSQQEQNNPPNVRKWVALK